MTRFPFGGPDFPSDDEIDIAEEVSEARCKYCRERGLHWEEGRGDHNRKKWVLVNEDGNIHGCRKPVKPSDFPLVPP